MQDWVGRDSLGQVSMVFLHGWLYDAAFLVYAGLLMGCCVAGLAICGVATLAYRQLCVIDLVVLLVYMMLFVGLSEWFFWDEFGARFNFIAVDYLVYSDEVISNIRESYPLPSLLSGIGLVALGLVIFAQGFIRNTLAFHVQLSRKQVLVCWLVSLMCAGLFAVTLDQRPLAAEQYLPARSGRKRALSVFCSFPE